ncbi:GNAT family N-acetyltransferase [Paenibacillus sp. p-8]
MNGDDLVQKIVIREYEPSDVEELALLMGDLGYPTTAGQMKARMEQFGRSSSSHTWIADLEGRVAGMAGCKDVLYYESDGFAVQISAFVVKKEYQGRGIGRELIRFVEKWAAERAAHTLFLTSGLKPERVLAHDFYQKNGFEVTGHRFVKRLGEPQEVPQV